MSLNISLGKIMFAAFGCMIFILAPSRAATFFPYSVFTAVHCLLYVEVRRLSCVVLSFSLSFSLRHTRIDTYTHTHSLTHSRSHKDKSTHTNKNRHKHTYINTNSQTTTNTNKHTHLLCLLLLWSANHLV